MARTRLEIKKQILEDLNQRVDELVDAILNEAEISKTKVNVSKMAEINTIINRVERMEFDGNVELLKETLAVYDKAIKAIDQQLESDNMKEFEKFSEESLKEAKQILEEQSKNGRVGTIFDKLEELSEAEKSGDIEKRYNDDKIEEIDYMTREQKEIEEKRIEPFNKIIAKTRESRENLQKINEIFNEFKELAEQREELIKEINSPDITEEEKEAKEEELKEITRRIPKVAAKAKINEKDTGYDIKEKEGAKDYIERVKGTLELRIKRM